MWNKILHTLHSIFLFFHVHLDLILSIKQDYDDKKEKEDESRKEDNL